MHRRYWQNSVSIHDKEKKASQPTYYRWNISQHNKGYLWQTTANIILNGEKLKVLTPRSEARQRCPLLPFLFNIVLEIQVTDIRKDIEGIQIGREEVKLSLFEDDMILYIENPKDTIRNLPGPISEFSKVTGYKINTQKSLAFLYPNNEKSEREIKEMILGINLPKEIKDLYIGKYKTLMKEIKNNTIRWRNIPCLGLEKSI